MRTPGRTRGRKPFRASLERLEGRQLLATITVSTTADAGPGSLREAIARANGQPDSDNIDFRIIPSDTDPGFDRATQTWRIRLNTPLPPIIYPLTIDGLTQANVPIPYRYPAQTTPDPSLIVSSPNSDAALDGYNAALRVIVDGSQTGGGQTGFDIQSTHTILRGLAINGFGTGVLVSGPDATGVLIQGNAIGNYLVYPVDADTGEPPPESASAQLIRQGNSGPGIVIASSNATIGGRLPQEANLIAGNGGQGVLVLRSAVGNLIAGNQIGVAGPTINGLFYISGNAQEGIRIESSGLDFPPGAGSSSTTVDVNLISANRGDGIHVIGPTAGRASTRINITGNYIGLGPGGGFRFGVSDTGNLGAGVRIDSGSDNRIGGNSVRDRNVIAANEGAGVRISGGNAVSNLVAGNYIGVTAGGDGALGNSLEGVVLAAPGNTVGPINPGDPGNLISANLRGVLIAGVEATNNRVTGNRIGTDATGLFDLGNAREGVRIEGASNNQITGDAAGSQVISGNNVGLLIIGGATRNVVQGNFIGTTVAGNSDLGNSLEGVRIEDAQENLIGGTTASVRNLISSNHWGVRLTGVGTFGNAVQGNFVGTDVSGTQPLGNELDGVLATNFASANLIGGASVAAGNTIAFNRRDGFRSNEFEIPIQLSIRNGVLTNRIFGNGGLPINLVPVEGVNSPTAVNPGVGPNRFQNAPVLTAVEPDVGFTTIRGTLTSAPGTAFTIQFFDVASGSYLGETTATTDASGVASITGTVPVAVAIGQKVAATATDPLNNTSEFSGEAINSPTTIEFEMFEFTVMEVSDGARITVTRSGTANTAVSIAYSTADGTARAGEDYRAVSGRLFFDPGVKSQTFTIPILFNPQLEGPETVLLNLSSPGGGAILGIPPSAVLTIIDDTADRTGPVVVSARAVAGRLGVASVILGFNEPLDPDRAVALVNYGYGVRIAGRDGRLGTRDDLLIGIAAAAYDPVARTMTLTLGRPVLKKTAMRVAINQATDVAGAGVGVSDVAGNLLDGDADGRPGGAYVTKVVARPVPRRPRVGIGRPRARSR